MTNQALVATPGTWQKKAMQEINKNINRQNVEERRVGRKKKHERGTLQDFKEEQFVLCSKGGINWVSYHERVLKLILYPWICQIDARTGMPVI